VVFAGLRRGHVRHRVDLGSPSYSFRTLVSVSAVENPQSQCEDFTGRKGSTGKSLET
jgi:hypothetical protein